MSHREGEARVSFEDFTHRAARNRFAFHGITSEDDFGF
jgi:hypothetical protein